MNASSPVHASYIFLLDPSGGVHAVPHQLYVALTRGEANSARWAGQKLRLADWYVRLEEGNPCDVVSEWYGWIEFDSSGAFDPTASSPASGESQTRTPDNVDVTAFPTPAERDRMWELLGRNSAGE